MLFAPSFLECADLSALWSAATCRNLTWLREKESNLQSLRPKRSVLPVTLSRKNQSEVSSPMSKVCLTLPDFGHWTLDFGHDLVGALGFEPRTLRLSGANTAYKAAALPLSYAPEFIADFRLSIANLVDTAPLLIGSERKSEFGNWQSAMNVVAVEGIEPTSLDYRSSALPLSYTAREKRSLNFGLWSLVFEVESG
jgi:hypothetical protein